MHFSEAVGDTEEVLCSVVKNKDSVVIISYHNEISLGRHPSGLENIKIRKMKMALENIMVNKVADISDI